MFLKSCYMNSAAINIGYWSSFWTLSIRTLNETYEYSHPVKMGFLELRALTCTAKDALSQDVRHSFPCVSGARSALSLP